MPSSFLPAAGRIGLAAALLSIAACTPQLDWRDYRPADGLYTVLMPAKPATHERPVTLNGMQLSMSMSAAEVRGVTYAVGSVSLPVPSLAMVTLGHMKDALLNNINSTIQTEKTTVSPLDRSISIQVEAIGTPAGTTDGRPRALFARFVARDARLFQVLVIGPQDAVTNEAVDTFLTSFKLN